MFGKESPMSAVVEGSENAQIVGNGNTIDQRKIFFNVDGSEPLLKSQIFDLLVTLRDTVIEKTPEFELTDPAETTTKLKKNRAGKYIRRFSRRSPELNDFNQVMEGIPDSEVIVLLLQSLYEDVAEFDESGELEFGDGAQHLDEVREKLFYRVVNSKGFNNEDFTREHVEQFVELLMLHGVWKCKLLKKPLDAEGGKSASAG